MDEIDYTDTGFNDFMNMYADKNPNKRMVQKNIKTSIPDINALNPLDAKVSMENTGLLSKSQKGLDKVGGAAGIASMAVGAVDIASSFSKDAYDTSAEGGGPISVEGAMINNAAKGAQAGMVLGPWGAAVGAAVGGGVGAFTAGKARKEWGENIITDNLHKNEIEKAENAETYQMEEGKESLGLLKGLRKKQLGIYNS